MAPRKLKKEGWITVMVTTRITRSSSSRLKRSVNRGLAAFEAKKRKLRKRGRAKKVKTEEGMEGVKEAGVSGRKTIVIEHCKQCNSFKTRAAQVKNGLEKGVPGVTVLVNPEKPRKGCFEIREEGGETFVTLLDMPRPFTPMKELDMDKVISDIIDKIK